MEKIHYKRVVYTCGFIKSVITSILGFAILLIFQNLMKAMGNPLTSSTQIIFGTLVTIACVSFILLFDSKKKSTKEAELDLIFEEMLKLRNERDERNE